MKLMDYGLKPIDFQNPDAARNTPDAGSSRRGFVVTSLAAGFAVASNPVLAQAITTDSAGLVAGEVSVPVADGRMPAYRAMPAGAGKFPVLLVVQEIFGVMSTSRTCAAAMPSWAITPSPPSCMRARATFRR